MPLKKICQQLNFIKQCRRYHLSLWQCPSFLIVLIDLIIISAMLSTYLVATKYTEQPEIVALIVIGVTTILTIISYFIIQGFEQLAEANQLKSEFVNIVSHQLRTPLTIIKWTINLMMKQTDNLPEKQLEKLKTIKENNQRMTDLVNDLLNVSRIEQGKLGLQPEKVALKEVIQNLIKDYLPLAKASNISLSLETDKNIPLISIDSQGIKVVLQNLIDNAIRYIKNKGQVKISLKRKKGLIKCQVQDNGVGIPPEDQRKIFQKFFRSRNIMKYQTEGTGLGLFISKSIIEASGGKIGFKSQEDKGSIFWFEIPIK